MNRDAALAVLAEEGWRLLVDAGIAVDEHAAAGDPLGAAAALAARRPDAAAEQRAAALELVTQGLRLARKLGVDERLIAVREAVEQATPGRVATWHASRIPPGCRLLEIGCGCGADSVALAHRAANLIATDTDPVRAACTHMNLMAYGLASARAIPGDGLEILATEGARADAIFVDPDRRPGGRRRRDPSAWSPPLDAVLALADGPRPVFVKAAPWLAPDAVEGRFAVTYVSYRRQCLEAFLESARESAQESPVRAVLLPDDLPSIVLQGDRGEAPAGPPGEALYVPDPAAMRARLLAELAQRHGLHLVDPGIALLTGAPGAAGPWLREQRVLSVLPLGAKTLRAAVRELAPCELRVHSRGVAASAEDLHARLRGALPARGSGPEVDVFATRSDGRPVAIVTTPAASARVTE